jgi:hypothetical protein
MRRTIAILSLTLTCGGFVSCSRQDTVAPQPEVNQKQGTGQTTSQEPAAVPQSHEHRIFAILTKTDLVGSNFQGIWQPSDADTIRAIHDARLYLEKLKRTTSEEYERAKIGEVLSGWDTYACQVVGHTKDGRKLIHLSFFPITQIENLMARRSRDWQHSYIIVNDGWTDYWRIEYDCKTKAFLDFQTNTMA